MLRASVVISRNAMVNSDTVRFFCVFSNIHSYYVR